MDCLHIIPGKGLSGYFFLDMSLQKAIKKLRSYSSKLPCVNIVEESSTKRIIVEIPECRIKLIFDECYQRLLIIEIDCRNSTCPRLPLIFQSKMYTNYSEILKAFETSSYKQLELSENSESSSNIKSFPRTPSTLHVCPSQVIEQYLGISLLLSSQELSKIFIHKNSTLPLIKNDIRVRIYEVRPLEKIMIRHSTGKIEDINWRIAPENLIELMGAPDYVRYRQGDNSGDFFYIYSSEGMDFLFSNEQNVLRKVIMHTNMLEDILFSEYERCNFIVYTDKGEVIPLSNFDQVKEKFEDKPVDVGIRRHGYGYRPTHCFKFPGVIFEILDTGYIASLALTPV